MKTIEKIQSIVGILIILLLIIIIVETLLIEPNLLRKNHRYTIAKVTKISASTEGGLSAEFTYNVKNKLYKRGGAVLGYFKVYEGDRYFIQYYTKNPNNCYILFESPVPEDIAEAPNEGWAKLPTFDDKSK